ncbi:MAG: RsmE family RNA methyltransferase, partial [Planctomycetota bacterium]
MPDRFFAPNCPETGSVSLDGPEAHHLMHVLRISAGQRIEVFDGHGLVATAEVVAVRKRDVELRIVTSRQEIPPSREVILGTAVPKGDRFDWLIEKATELGVTRIVPLITSRSSVDPRDSKLDKLRQTVITACKQCGRNHLLELSPVTPWADFVRNEFPNRAVFIAHPSSDTSPLSFDGSTLDPQPSTVFAIGPE